MKKELQTAFQTRQYMLQPDFELYFYNDALIDSVKNHSHDYYEFYFFLSGNAVITINERDYPIKKGNMALIPPHTIHRLKVMDHVNPYQRFVFWIAKDYVDLMIQHSPSTSLIFEAVEGENPSYLFYFDLFEFNSLQSKLLEIIEENHQDHFGKQEKINNCINSLLLDFSRKVYNLNNQKVEPVKPLFVNVLEYIDRHLDDDLSLDAIAKHFYVSKYHLSHVFKDNMGISLHQYILKKRLKVVSSAIIGNKDISSVYAQYGFKDYSSFYRAFKNEFGMSPKQYKQNYENALKASQTEDEQKTSKMLTDV